MLQIYCDDPYIFRNSLYTLQSRTWAKNSKFREERFRFNCNSNLTTEWVYLYHNTYFTDIPERNGFRFASNRTGHKVIARNNIFAGTGYAFSFRCDEVPLDFDYDDLFASSPSYFAEWGWKNRISREEFLTRSMLEPHGLFVAPGFENAAKEDFRLKQDSKLVGKGIRIPGVNDDYQGGGPDIGAFEYGLNQTCQGRDE